VSDVSSSWPLGSCRACVWIGLFAALIFTSGCVSSRAFMPTEHVTAFSPGGSQYAAEYPIVESGSSLGDVKVWSDGATRDGSDAEPRTTVRVGFELSNHAGAPLRFDAKQLFLEELARKGEPAGRVPPTSVAGETLVPPGQSRQLDVRFTLPSSVWPSDVPGYRVAWSVVGRRVHSRKTPFARVVAPPRPVDAWYYPYYGYYYPGFYGSWSFGYRGWPPPWRARRLYIIR
jgi:hypothetical protein